MNRGPFRVLYWVAILLTGSAATRAQTAPPSVDPTTTAAAAAVAGGYAEPAPPDLVEAAVDAVLRLLDLPATGNTPVHYGLAALFLVGAYLLRNVLTRVAFTALRRLASRTRTRLDDHLLPAIEPPVAAAIALFGFVLAMKVLKLPDQWAATLRHGYQVAFTLVLFWLIMRAFSALLSHLHLVAQERKLGVAAFLPWIRKTVVAIIAIFGVLMVAQSLGADVKAFLAGLGIGGLAFALAAQDTLGNVFGSVVVAVDQPFRVGDFVQIGSHMGTVEDIGLRSTKLRTPARTLIAIPNKTVAAEAINNFTRMPQRRVDQTIGLTYSTKPEQMELILADLRRLIEEDPGTAKDFIVVRFANFGAYSLDIQIIYFAADPDMRKHLELRERLNLAFMRAVAARGLGFAFPTQTLHLHQETPRPLAPLAAAV